MVDSGDDGRCRWAEMLWLIYLSDGARAGLLYRTTSKRDENGSEVESNRPGEMGSQKTSGASSRLGHRYGFG